MPPPHLRRPVAMAPASSPPNLFDLVDFGYSCLPNFTPGREGDIGVFLDFGSSNTRLWVAHRTPDGRESGSSVVFARAFHDGQEMGNCIALPRRRKDEDSNDWDKRKTEYCYGNQARDLTTSADWFVLERVKEGLAGGETIVLRKEKDLLARHHPGLTHTDLALHLMFLRIREFMKHHYRYDYKWQIVIALPSFMIGHLSKRLEQELASLLVTWFLNHPFNHGHEPPRKLELAITVESEPHMCITSFVPRLLQHPVLERQIRKPLQESGCFIFIVLDIGAYTTDVATAYLVSVDPVQCSLKLPESDSTLGVNTVLDQVAERLRDRFPGDPRRRILWYEKMRTFLSKSEMFIKSSDPCPRGDKFHDTEDLIACNQFFITGFDNVHRDIAEKVCERVQGEVSEGANPHNIAVGLTGGGAKSRKLKDRVCQMVQERCPETHLLFRSVGGTDDFDYGDDQMLHLMDGASRLWKDPMSVFHLLAPQTIFISMHSEATKATDSTETPIMVVMKGQNLRKSRSKSYEPAHPGRPLEMQLELYHEEYPNEEASWVFDLGVWTPRDPDRTDWPRTPDTRLLCANTDDLIKRCDFNHKLVNTVPRDETDTCRGHKITLALFSIPVGLHVLRVLVCPTTAVPLPRPLHVTPHDAIFKILLDRTPVLTRHGVDMMRDCPHTIWLADDPVNSAILHDHTSASLQDITAGSTSAQRTAQMIEGEAQDEAQDDEPAAGEQDAREEEDGLVYKSAQYSKKRKRAAQMTETPPACRRTRRTRKPARKMQSK